MTWDETFSSLINALTNVCCDQSKPFDFSVCSNMKYDPDSSRIFCEANNDVNRFSGAENNLQRLTLTGWLHIWTMNIYDILYMTGQVKLYLGGSLRLTRRSAILWWRCSCCCCLTASFAPKSGACFRSGAGGMRSVGGEMLVTPSAPPRAVLFCRPGH